MSQRSDLRVNTIAVGNLRRIEEAKTKGLSPAVTSAIFQEYGTNYSSEDIVILRQAVALIRQGGHRAVPKKVIDEAAETNAILKAITGAAERQTESMTNL